MHDNTDDKEIMSHIENLTAKIDRVYLKGDLTSAETTELHRLRNEADQYWDLVRQRRALRETGKDPNKAELRPIGTVEGYRE